MENTEQYVGVRVKTQNYAIPILEIQEIIRMQEITEVPNTRACVLGVINIRGKIIPVVSLRERIGLPEVEHTKHTRIVIVMDGDSEMGVIVDSVNQVLSFEDIQPPPENGEVAYLRGIGRKDELLVSILDLQKLIDN